MSQLRKNPIVQTGILRNQRNLQSVPIPKFPKYEYHIPKDWNNLNNRCVNAIPKSNDFGQSINFYQSFYKPSKRQAVEEQNQTETKQFVAKKQSMKCSCAQFVTKEDTATSDSKIWHLIDTAADIDKIISVNKDIHPDNVLISKSPRFKVIAEKYIKYKKNGVELRKLDLKIVCLEYDVFEKDDVLTPVRRMRAFFAIKPFFTTKEGAKGDNISSKDDVNRNFKLENTPVKHEIEIIDKNVKGNQSYLNDLKRILKRRKESCNVKKRSTLNLKALYNIAKENNSIPGAIYSTGDLLNMQELQEVKELIIKNCDSNLEGICRKKLDKPETIDAHNVLSVITLSVVDELLNLN